MDVGLLSLLAIFVPILGSAAVPLVAAASRRAAGPTAVAFAAATGVFTTLLLFDLRPAPVIASSWIPTLGLSFDVRVDALSASVAAIAGILGALVVLYSTAYMRHAAVEGYSLPRYYAYILLFIGAMVGLALADSLLAFLIFWETVGLCSFLLISFYHRDPKARRAGIKALAVTQAGGIGLVVAVVALWSQHGITTFSALLAASPAAAALPLAAFGVLAAAFAKSAQFPFHPWLPDAMEAPTTVSALIHAATMVNAGVYLVARTLPAFSGVPLWLETVLWVGVASALLGAVGALAERDLKRVLAYSTISQLGFMFAAVGAGAMFAGSFHLLSQALFKALLFLAAGAVIQAAGSRDLFKMGGLGATMRLTSVSFLIGAISMAGIPPLVGFWSKDLVLEGVLHASAPAFLVLAGVALLTAVYALRAWWLAFAGSARGAAGAHEAPLPMVSVVAVLAGATLLAGVLLEPMSAAFVRTLPAYEVASLTLAVALTAMLTSSTVGVTLAVAGVAAYLLVVHRARFEREPAPDAALARGLTRALRSGFGLGAFFDILVDGFARLGRAMLRLDTRDLNLNSGAVLGTLALLVVVFSSGVI
ncbi:MAG TPA: NADH-quinone oxidoreductase subunit L [Candidatus Thermoplasmatota archaeon]|nr:NADH-quinone oxidoreductase subunit L [Candidatus Thermoplasmatota archaeon]